MKKSRNKVVIVTGGAGGIGRVIVEHFLMGGASVVVVDRNTRQLNIMAKELEKKNPAFRNRIVVRRADVSQPRGTVNTAAFAKKKFGSIDVLVNCAGIQAPIGTFASSDIKLWGKNIGINLLGTANMMHAVLPYMMKKRAGSIINFSGGGATGSRPYFSAYAAAKTAVVRLTEIVADEMKEWGIRVNAIAPGAVNTAMLEEVLRVGKGVGAKEIKEAKERKEKGGTPPERAAELVLYLASSASEGLTGKLLSAVWDPWKEWKEKDIKKIRESDNYTLRRKT